MLAFWGATLGFHYWILAFWGATLGFHYWLLACLGGHPGFSLMAFLGGHPGFSLLDTGFFGGPPLAYLRVRLRFTVFDNA